MKIRGTNKSKLKLPFYSTEMSSCMNIRTKIEELILPAPFERAVVNAGQYLEITIGYEAQIRPGSRLAIKNGVNLVNSSDRIDADY
jgi:dUTP pyrophosphatase